MFKKILGALVSLLLVGGIASAQTVVRSSDDSGRVLFKSDGGRWAFIRGNGAPSFSTFGSENVPEDTLYIDEDTGGVYYFSASAWVASTATAGTVVPGTTATTGCTDKFLFANASSVLDCDAAFVADDSGAGNGVFTARKTMSGSSGFLTVSGTIPASASASQYGVFLNFATTAASTYDPTGLRLNLTAGLTTGVSQGLHVSNAAAGQNAGSYLAQGGNRGGVFSATGTGSVAYNTGVNAIATGAGTNNLGVFGGATSATGSPTRNMGGAFYAANGTGNTGLLAVYGASLITPVNSAFDSTNASSAVPIACFRDNSAALPTTGATATSCFVDGAWLQAGNGVLTDATMTAETQARQSSGLIHSYTWTNAQVVALGASTTGDITVATLPAKTQVKNAYVVITGQGAGTTTLTVSCGDAVGGTPFINYVVASDAKAAANTVYGDAVAERGTSLDTEFWYLPSYTATTLVTCHFISTGANLDQVTGSTGRVILETALLP